jgi:hypothetical protein
VYSNKSSDPDPTTTKKRTSGDDLSADILKNLKRLDDFEQKEKLILEQVRFSSSKLLLFHSYIFTARVFFQTD